MEDIHLEHLNSMLENIKEKCLCSMRTFVDAKTDYDVHVWKMMVDTYMKIQIDVVCEIETYNLNLKRRA